MIVTLVLLPLPCPRLRQTCRSQMILIPESLSYGTTTRMLFRTGKDEE